MTRPKVLAFVLLAAVVAFSLSWFGCSEKLGNMTGPQGVDDLSGQAAPAPSEVQAVIEVQDRHTGRLLAIEGVVGTATGLNDEGEVVIKVYTLRPDVTGIPESLEDVPVDVRVSGEIVALKKPPNTGKPDREKTPSGTDKFERPVPTGVSVGNLRECSSGTIGCVLHKGDDLYILSNNHVLAMENRGREGDPIVQPGTYDNRPRCRQKPQNEIATLHDWEPLKFDGSLNEIDAAIALAGDGKVGCCTHTTEYGCPSSTTVLAEVGMAVQKVGRTTGHTTGTVTDVNGAFWVGYSSGNALFVDQIVVLGSGFLRSGDSGSLLVTADGNEPTGLLFAGNNVDLALANHIGPVLVRFGGTTICSQ